MQAQMPFVDRHKPRQRAASYGSSLASCRVSITGLKSKDLANLDCTSDPVHYKAGLQYSETAYVSVYLGNKDTEQGLVATTG